MVILTAPCDLIYIIIGLLLASTWALGSRDSDYKSNRFTFIFHRLYWCRARMVASSDRSNVLLCASTTLSVVTICLFVVACCYFQWVINVQNEQLVLLTDQQDNLKNEVSTLKRKCEEQHTTVSHGPRIQLRIVAGYYYIAGVSWPGLQSPLLSFIGFVKDTGYRRLESL